MSKLSYIQAVNLVEQATQESLQNRDYRLGQALWNLLPSDWSEHYLATDKDFFYWEDNAKVIETFYELFVDHTLDMDGNPLPQFNKE